MEVLGFGRHCQLYVWVIYSSNENDRNSLLRGVREGFGNTVEVAVGVELVVGEVGVNIGWENAWDFMDIDS